MVQKMDKHFPKQTFTGRQTLENPSTNSETGHPGNMTVIQTTFYQSQPTDFTFTETVELLKEIFRKKTVTV